MMKSVKKLVVAALMAFGVFATSPALVTAGPAITPVTAPATTPALLNVDQMVAHGGGCRQSSPPGQCCHMDHKTGIVHCH
ncbi:hypothetical protein [Thalassospira sp.]|uniref:hypothetical protein n=1 Tax=Thalassospira sp. TaxID=1912094 RepID=UPI003AA87B1B